MNMIWITIAISLGGGIFSLLFLRKAKRLQWVLFFANAVFQVYVAVKLFALRGEVFSTSLPFELPGLGVPELTFSISHLGYLFFVASVIITVVLALFSLSYNDKKHATGIAPLWMMLMAANMGIFFSADWIMFLLSWELMGWTSFFIISHGREKSAKAGLYYFIISLVGTSALLAGVLLTVKFSGSLLIKEGIQALSTGWVNFSGQIIAVAVLFTVTFFAKSAVLPFFMWPSLAHAEAPDDFSAFLSGVMIKYGVFGMIMIVIPLFGVAYNGPMVREVPLYLYILGWIGVFTAVWGTFHAIREDDMKRMMAHSTVSHIGFITAGLAMGGPYGIAAALFHTFNHMVFKSAIFMSMGAVKYRTGERDMHKIGGMAYRMPLTFFTFLMAIIAAAGIPPMSGFSSKWLVYQSMFGQDALFMTIPAFLASTGGFLYLYRGLHTIFLGQLPQKFEKVKEAPFLQAVPMTILMLFIFAVGMLPGIVLTPVNEVVKSMGLAGIEQDLFSITGTTIHINVFHIGLAFVGAFGIVFIMFMIGKRRKKVEFLDTYTSGEEPADWGLTHKDLHYGMRFYEPFEDMINPMLETLSLDKLFRRIAYETERLSGAIRRWFGSPQFGMFVIIIAILIALLVGRTL